MGNANFVNNRLQNDDGTEVSDLPFSDQMAVGFTYQIEHFQEQRGYIPAGWRSLFDDAVHMLRAVDCSKRNYIELSEPATVKGSLRVQAHYAPTDKVVRGILNRLAKRTECTCEVCGRGYGAVYRTQSDKTLCAGCHVKQDLSAELDLWLGSNYRSRKHRDRPIIEFASLPINIQLLIPEHMLNEFRLVAQSGYITYVTPGVVRSQTAMLKEMQRYLNQTENPL